MFIVNVPLLLHVSTVSIMADVYVEDKATHTAGGGGGVGGGGGGGVGGGGGPGDLSLLLPLWPWRHSGKVGLHPRQPLRLLPVAELVYTGDRS